MICTQKESDLNSKTENPIAKNQTHKFDFFFKKKRPAKLLFPTPQQIQYPTLPYK